MNKILLFLQLVLPIVGFAQSSYYTEGEIYKIDDSLSLKCNWGIAVLSLSDINEPLAHELYDYNDYSEDELHAIHVANFNYNEKDIFKAITDTFSTDEINRWTDDLDFLMIGFVFDREGKCEYIHLVFPRFSDHMMTIAPQRYGMLYKNLLKISFKIVDKHVKYNSGTLKIQMKDVRQSIIR